MGEGWVRAQALNEAGSWVAEAGKGGIGVLVCYGLA